MPRTTLSKVALPTEVGATDGTVITPTPADEPTNHNQFSLTGNEILLVLNTAASTGTVTVSSKTDRYGRVKDITAVTIPAAVAGMPGMKVFPRFTLEGWQQPDGFCYLAASAVTIWFIVIQL